ncbi:extensin-like [Magnolia sinica]|uniref:extensin-like n=1 Tax=Magnolia sinica TaxID=86752 RepID=UPI0026594B74|nr:extensin-like [Magnolia sinica]
MKMATIFIQPISAILFLIMVTKFPIAETSDAANSNKIQYNSPSPPTECEYPCLPPPTSTATPNGPPPSPPSPPSGLGSYNPPPATGGYYYPPPSGYLPYGPPPYLTYPGPPPPDPILPYFPFYSRKSPPSSSAIAIGNNPTVVILHLIFLGFFLS